MRGAGVRIGARSLVVLVAMLGGCLSVRMVCSSPASAGGPVLAGPLETSSVSPAKTLGAGPVESPGQNPGGTLGQGSSTPKVKGEEAGGIVQPSPASPSAMTTVSLESPFQAEGSPVLLPEQLSTDAASRLAFAGLGGDAAVALAKRDFHIETPTWAAPGSESGSHITQYLGSSAASEERPGGEHVLVQSTLPLQTENGSGAMVPVSVTLHEAGGAYVPANPLVPISISKTAASGVSFLSSGIGVVPVSASAGEAAVVVGNRLMWTNTATDTDFISEPLPGGIGVEDSWQLRSQSSPRDNSLAFRLPPGASLRTSTTVPGGAEVEIEGRPLLLIPPASAHGADGRSIPVSYSASGNVLTTHVDLSGNIDFPALVDPEVIGYYGEAGGNNGWQYWGEESNCGGCFGFIKASNLIQAGAEVGWPEGDWGQVYIGTPTSGLAKVTRVDVTGLQHNAENQSSLNIGIWGSNGTEEYSNNGFAGLSGPAPLITNKAYSGQSMAICADGAGGHDGGEQPLCDECKTYNQAHECTEAFGGGGFDLGDYLLASRNEFNFVRLSSATIRFIQIAPPTVSTESSVLARWSSSGSPYVHVRGEDKGVGVSAVGVDAVKGVRTAYSNGSNPEHEMPVPGSSPASGTSPYAPACGDPYCFEWISDGFTASGVQTGIWTLGGWAHNAVSLNAEQTYTAYIDRTPPSVATPSWEGSTFGDGAHPLSFSAKDGSASEPQSGVRLIHVYVDGRYVSNDLTTCPEPKETNIIPSEPCLGLSGSWTLQGEDYGAGPHTVTVWAEDWVGNTSERTFHVTIGHPVGDTQQVGPGTLDVRSGDYSLGATDVSLPAGTATLSISRSYDSQSKEPAGPLGPGWLLSTPDASAGGQWQSLQVLPEGRIEATTTGEQKVMFASNGKGGYVSPTGFQTYSLTQLSGSPVTYQIIDSGGDYTQFTEPSGATTFMPSVVAQAVNKGGLNKVTYVLREGKTSEIVGSVSAGESCSGTLSEGCRVLTLHYATSKTATGEAPSEWGSYVGQLASVSFTAAQSKMIPITVAEYAYDKQGRLRAEWDPRISPALKTIYGYDTEGHVTALTPPGQQPWALTYGTISGDSTTGRLMAVTRAQPVGTTKEEIKTKLKEQGEQEKNTEAPKLSGSAVLGVKMSVTRGAWSNSPVAYGYQWEDCNSVGEACSPVPGAVNPTYTPASNDTGHTLVAQVTATNGWGSVIASSAPSAVIGTPVYSSQFGGEGTGGGQFKHPGDIALDAKGNVWVLDNSNNRVEEFSATGGFIKTFGFGVSNGEVKFQICTSSCRTGVSGAGSGQFSGPDALTIDSKGNVWVADTGNSRIEEFNEKGEYVETVGTAGSGNGQLSHAEGVAVDSHGNVWVSDTYNHRLEVFTEKGVFSKVVTSSHLEEPEHLVIDAHGNVWVTDWRGGVDEFDQNGFWLNTFTGLGTNKLENPYGIALESNGNVLVLDAKHNRVESFTEKGEYEIQFGSTGSGAGQFSLSYPMGLASDSHGDVWVGDSNNNRVEKWAVPVTGSEEGVTPPSPSPRVTVEYGVPVSGSGAPYSMSSTEVAKWGQGDAPAEATAIFPPDKVEGWPAGATEDYKHASVSYFDSTGRLVNVAGPGGAISMTQYEAYGNVERSLTAGNRQHALEAGSESVAKAELLATKSTYRLEGTELESRVGPQHEVKLANGTVTQARARTRYYYDEGAPSSEIPYRLVTETTEGALLPSGEEKDVRTLKNSYSGQSGLGWELHKPTSVIVEPETGKTLTRTTTYSSETGDVVETKAPAGSESQSPQPPTYSSQIGSGGEGSGHYNSPKGIAFDGKGDIAVADEENARVDIFKETGEFVKSFGEWGTENGQFLEIRGVAVDSKGDIWTVDAGRANIQEFSEKGTYLKTIGTYGTGAGDLEEPKGITIDSHNAVLVADTGNNRIEKFNEKGEFVAVYGFGVSNGEEKLESCTSACRAGRPGTGNGQLEKPRELATGPAGEIWVTDTGNNRVEGFTESGGFIKTIGAPGTGLGQFKEPKGITIDAKGNFFVVDAENDRVEEFTTKGEYETEFGSEGSSNGQFKEPWGILVNIHGEIFVSDAGNNRIEKFVPAQSGNPEVHDTQTIYYSASANPVTPACGKHPEWANLPCQTQPAAQPQVGPNLPVSTVTYNIWDEAETTTEKVTGKSGETTRTSTQTYDAAGRLKESAINSTTGRSVPTATDEYSEETGALIKQGAGGKSIISAYNTLGQLTSYIDAAGTTATYEYEKEGDDRLTKTNDGKGTQTHEYDKTTGQATALKDSGAGTFSATYNTEGQIATETYPNGMKATYTYNSIGQVTTMVYAKGSATWYKDETMLSIHGQSLTQTSTLGAESYTYDGIGRMTQAQETPAGKGCATYLYAYDADSNRVGQTKREPGTGGACATEGGTTTAHSYDEADRLTDPGTAYESLGENTIVPASDAGGHALESTYYTDGAIYSQTQNEQTNTYLLDPTGRALETTAVKGMSSKATTSHYSGTGSTPAWTETEGSWTRNITGITSGLAATQTNGGEAIIELANLHGDIIGTVPDNSGAESATLTNEPTAFGIPATATSSKYSWLGSGGLQIEFTASGIAASPEGAYIPQLGIYLTPEGLTGTAAQDPVNEYLSDMTLAQPTSYGTSTSPGAIEPLPVNAKIEKEWHEHPAWNQPPTNVPGAEDPQHILVLFTPQEAIEDGDILCGCTTAKGIGTVIEAIAKKVGVEGFGEVVEEFLTGGLAESIGKELLNCGKTLSSNTLNRCALELHTLAVFGKDTWFPTGLGIGYCYYYKKSYKGEKIGLHCPDHKYYKRGSY